MKARRIEGLEPGTGLRANARLILRTRLEELRTLGEQAVAPDEVTAQHDTRIAAKRLRYVLEITGACFGEEAIEARGAARRLQGVLGEVHDCDVMLPRVAGIESAEALLRARREHCFRRFLDLWRQEERRGTWDRLGAAL